MIELRRLLERGGRNAAELARALQVSVPTVMRGIRRLREAGESIEAVKTPRGWQYRLGERGGRARGIPAFPRRPRDAHKGSVGRVLLMAGSRGMAGAAALACRAAYRAGAGQVYVAAPDAIVDTLAVKLTEAVIVPLRPGDGAGLRETIARCRAAAIGPGLSRRPPARAFARRIFETLELPLVVDADALAAVPGSRAAGPRLLTPHEGEMAGLLGRPVADREADAREAARRFGAIVILKGPGSVITDGRRLAINRTGNPGLAKAGTGDVLTGILLALLGQGFDPWDAAVLGTHLHGRAGDLAAARLGQISMIASDVIEHLPQAVHEQSMVNR